MKITYFEENFDLATLSNRNCKQKKNCNLWVWQKLLGKSASWARSSWEICHAVACLKYSAQSAVKRVRQSSQTNCSFGSVDCLSFPGLVLGLLVDTSKHLTLYQRLVLSLVLSIFSRRLLSNDNHFYSGVDYFFIYDITKLCWFADDFCWIYIVFCILYWYK